MAISIKTRKSDCATVGLPGPRQAAPAPAGEVVDHLRALARAAGADRVESVARVEPTEHTMHDRGEDRDVA